MAWPVSRDHANGGALFWWNYTKKILRLVREIFYSHTEGIALINWIEFPLCHHRRSQGGNQLTTYKVMHSLPHASQYPLRPNGHVFSCRAIDMCYCFATPFKYSAFLYFRIQDNEDDFSGTAQNGLMFTDLYCLFCFLQCVSVNCKMSQHAQSACNIEQKEACPGN